MIALAVLTLWLLIKLVRRAGPGLAIAAVASAIPPTRRMAFPQESLVVEPAAVGRQKKQKREMAKEPVDEEFLKARVKDIAQSGDPLLTPGQMCDLLNHIFEIGNRPMPFDSPMQMARVLKKKLGLISVLKTVPNRPERRWYDLTGYPVNASS
jgi:hypothetical protein